MKAKAVALILVCLSAREAATQTMTPEQAFKEAAAGAARREGFGVLERADAATPLALPKPTFTLEGGKEEKKVTGTIGVAFESTTLDLTFSGPIGEGADEASPITLDGLAGGTSVSVGFTGSRVVKDALSLADVGTQSALCKAQELTTDCGLEDLLGKNRSAFLRTFMVRVPTYYGLHAKLARKEFTYTANESLAKDTVQTHAAGSVVGSFGILTPQLWFVAAHVDYQRFYKAAGKPKELCFPYTVDGTAVSGVATCRSTTIGEPQKKADTVLTVEGRRVFTDRGVGVNPTLRYSVGDKVTTVELPLYFLSEKSEAENNPVPSLNGGISVGWHSKNGLVARAFVGVAFGLIDLHQP